VEIDTRALEDNYRLLRSLAPECAECLAVVKADAYGHGLGLCAPAAVKAGAQWLGVTSVEEGVAARAACPNARIVVMCGAFPGEGDAVIAHRLTPVVWERWQIADLEAAARGAGLAPGSLPVHLEIDTGMSRQGVSLEALHSLLAEFALASPLRVEAVMTHLYASDEADSLRTAKQLRELERALIELAPTLRPEWLSVGASSALLSGTADKIAALAARWNLQPMLRLGLALYGVVPRFEPAFAPGAEPASMRRGLAAVRPVMSWKSQVVSVREIPHGAEVGYNGTFVATEPMRVALVSAGYADGLDRRLSNRFSVLVGGQRAPLVGRISMDHCVVDVTEIGGVRQGDEVVLLGMQNGETVSAYDHADASGTIPWEVFTRIGARVPRTAI
jgi:alanine racemase